jgi:Spy/CpxP family protein refolding chaperone
MSDMTSTPAGKPARRWLGPALLISVAFNLFLVALISVPFFKGPPDDGFGPMPRGPGAGLMHGAFRELPEEDRQALRQAMRERFRDIRPHFREMHEARNALADALAAEPYDEAAARAAFDSMSASMIVMSEMGRDVMLETFAKLTPEQRKRVADAMRKDRDRMMMRWRKDGRDGGPGDMPPPPME